MRVGVHDTPRHLARLEEAVATHAAHRLIADVRPLARAILDGAAALAPLPSPSTLPPRVCHGDLKFNNILFAGRTPPADARAVCLIDLDTVGPLSLAFELGDAWRSWCNRAGEDDVNAVLDLEIMRASLDGYVAGLGRALDAASSAAPCCSASSGSAWSWPPASPPTRSSNRTSAGTRRASPAAASTTWFARAASGRCTRRCSRRARRAGRCSRDTDGGTMKARGGLGRCAVRDRRRLLELGRGLGRHDRRPRLRVAGQRQLLEGELRGRDGLRGADDGDRRAQRRQQDLHLPERRDDHLRFAVAAAAAHRRAATPGISRSTEAGTECLRYDSADNDNFKLVVVRRRRHADAPPAPRHDPHHHLPRRRRHLHFERALAAVLRSERPHLGRLGRRRHRREPRSLPVRSQPPAADDVQLHALPLRRRRPPQLRPGAPASLDAAPTLRGACPDSTLSGMRVFVTGATGVVGRRVVPLLATGGHEVTCAVRSRGQHAAVTELGARPVEVDLFDRARLTAALVGHDVFINLATHMPRSTWRAFLPGAWRENDHIRRDAVPIMTAAALRRRRRPLRAGILRADLRGRGRRVDRRGRAAATGAHQPQHPRRRTRGAPVHARRAASASCSGSRRSTAPTRSSWARWSRSSAAAGARCPARRRASCRACRTTTRPRPSRPRLSLPAGIYNVADDEPLRHRDFVDALARAVGAAPPRLFPAWLTQIGGSLARMYARSLRISNMKLRQQGWAPRYPSARDGLPAAIAALA